MGVAIVAEPVGNEKGRHENQQYLEVSHAIAYSCGAGGSCAFWLALHL